MENFFVDAAVWVAEALRMPKFLIGAAIVSIATMLFELITTITSITKKQGELGVCNIINANIIDLVLILLACFFISKGRLIIGPQSMRLDISACLLILLLAVLPALINKKFIKVQCFLMSQFMLYILFLLQL